ncbi:MAG: peptidylprolyl isomerase [Bacteroidota bacterium]
MKKISALLCSLVICFLVNAQNDPILFSVDGVGVPLSEFEYIYNKNNGENANYSKASIEEYLDLYTKFKLKVARAKDMKLDTIKSLQEELEGYKKQLSNSYLVDKEVTEKLVKEAYDRSLKDVQFSHILVQVKASSSDEDVARFKKIADEIYDRIQKGEKFEELAETESDDPNSSKNGGLVGFVNAMLPNGFYDLETALYTTPEGEVTAPVKSPIGFHIIKINKIRKAVGKIEVAHILVRKRKDSQGNTEQKKINQAYTFLKDGGDWAQAVKDFSEDKKTMNNSGFIGALKIGQYEEAFETAAYGLKNDEDITPPFETRIGWHIVKRISRDEQPSFGQSKKRLQAQISKDKRLEIVKREIIDRIKAEGNYTLDANAMSQIKDNSGDDFFTYKWAAPQIEDANLFEIGGTSYSNNDFIQYLKKNARKRLLGRRAGFDKTLDNLFQEYVDEKAIKYEETKLSEKYPEFRNLMREYEEGVLLFEATKMMVWDKASADTVGLKAFHASNKDNYKWGERATVYTININTTDEKLAKKALKKLKKLPVSTIAPKLNAKTKNLISYSKKTLEKDNFSDKNLAWSKGALSPLEKDDAKQMYQFKKLESIQAGANKTLGEARGYVIADYQDYLEKEWVKELRSQYPLLYLQTETQGEDWGYVLIQGD